MFCKTHLFIVIWVLMNSTKWQLYRDGQFYWWVNRILNTTDRRHVIWQFLTQIMLYRVYQVTTSATTDLDTDRKCRRTSNCSTVTATAAPRYHFI